MQGMWEFWIDRGGTFTDCIARAPDGTSQTVKVLSDDRAPLTAIRQAMGLAEQAAIPPCRIRMGTTVATNALLERTGRPTALAITAGFGDALAIGTQARPELFSLAINKPATLYQEVVEIDARMAADGTVLTRLDRDRVQSQLAQVRAQGVTSLAIVLLHGYAHPSHEQVVAEVAQELAFDWVSMSSQVAPVIGLTGRGDTTCVDAYLSPLLRDYLAALQAELPGSELLLMQSSGVLTGADAFRGHNGILSGPAGGVVAVAHVAASVGMERAVGFDMGGTSTDVCRVDDPTGSTFEKMYETVTAGVRVQAPMLAIHTVAAGGGSICRVRGARMTVGPDSAGADPGPLCYGRNSATELTVTDLNLALGRLQPDRFPLPLQPQRVQQHLTQLAASLSGDRGAISTPEQLAAGFLTIANSNMAQAIRKISIQRGVDVRDYPLVVFGGAGGQHACAIARELAIQTVLLHPQAGVLSALGMGLSDPGWNGQTPVASWTLDEQTINKLTPVWRQLEAQGRAAVTARIDREAALSVVRLLDLRYRDSQSTLTIAQPADGQWREAFEQRHQERFSHRRDRVPVEVVQARVEVISRQPSPAVGETVGSGAPTPVDHCRIWLDGGWQEGVPVYQREALSPGPPIVGPALILEATGTVLVDAGFHAEVHATGVLMLTDQQDSDEVKNRDTQVDPVRLEVFGNRFMSVAEQMGVVLRQSAISTNIKERLDFSCAVFDREGQLVANAPHIPVHLGAMGETVRHVLAAHPQMTDGDSFVSNAPDCGGSHLPDITVVTPVLIDGVRRFFTASRGHHADVGGISPGSMPPFSTRLSEEGVVLSAEILVRAGEWQGEMLRSILASGPHPARDPEGNLADLAAQVAANQTGRRLLIELVRQQGLATVSAYMGHVQDNARDEVMAAIGQLPDGRHHFADQMDDGTPVVVTVTVDGSRMVIDFAGTGPQVQGNLNAPPAVVQSAVLYFLRTLVDAPIPLNAGCLIPVEVKVPSGSILCPDPGAAVAAGNVESAQRVVDVLLGAVGRAAASQGTMNNLTFGNQQAGYYETIAGGAGAVWDETSASGTAGASGVHTHMTNTRITDAEVLELHHPVQLLRFAFRPGSGGTGRWPGGDGLVRHLRFLQPLTVCLLCERRTVAPFGLDGGGAGKPGKAYLKRAGENGGFQELPGKTGFQVQAGDELIIESPGGGAIGSLPKAVSTS